MEKNKKIILKIFIFQIISIIVVACFITELSIFTLLWFFLVGYGFIFDFSNPYRGGKMFSAFIVLVFFIMYHFPALTILKNNYFKPNYNNLEFFTGEVFNPANREELGLKADKNCAATSCHISSAPLYLRNEKGEIKQFMCNIISKNSCINLFQDRERISKKYKFKKLSIKYNKTSFPLLFLTILGVYDFNLVYEIEFDNKIILSYDYFVNKYEKERIFLLLFLIYISLNSTIFYIMYSKIQVYRKLNYG